MLSVHYFRSMREARVLNLLMRRDMTERSFFIHDERLFPSTSMLAHKDLAINPVIFSIAALHLKRLHDFVVENGAMSWTCVLHATRVRETMPTANQSR